MCEFHARKSIRADDFLEKCAWHPICFEIGLSERVWAAIAEWISMKTLLRDIATGLYFKGPDNWTGNAAEARDFKAIDRAIEFIHTWNLDGVELAFFFRGSNDVTSVPVEKIVEI
jgi:hypothetical protein